MYVIASQWQQAPHRCDAGGTNTASKQITFFPRRHGNAQRLALPSAPNPKGGDRAVW